MPSGNSITYGAKIFFILVNVMKVISIYKNYDWLNSDEKYTLTLPAAERSLRHKKLVLDDGSYVYVDFDQVIYLQNLDALKLEDNNLIKIIAAKEKIMNITCKDSIHLSKIAWHIGNRHCPLQIIDEKNLRIEQNNVLFDMLQALDTKVNLDKDTFDPEQGAFSGH